MNRKKEKFTNQSVWFSENDINIDNKINLKNLHGFVLPHASTKYTGKIISHTLQFKPIKSFDTVIIIYYPVSNTENVDNKYYHEYFVPFMSLKYCIKKYWNINKKIKYIGIDLKNNKNINKLKLSNSLVVLSVDFSHHLTLQNALKLEDKAAHSLMFRNLEDNDYNNIIDHKLSFEYLYNYLQRDYEFQWIGRTRSPGLKGVGYLSFLLIKNTNKDNKKIDGYYVTVYDEQMNSRECLGRYDKNTNNLDNFIVEVINKAKTTSRLTGGNNLDIPVTNYTITYLYEEKHKNFIRGYHAIRIKDGALYLPDVFLENTFNNGKWINKTNKNWQHGDFDLNPTLEKLNTKGMTNNNNYILYKTEIEHYDI